MDNQEMRGMDEVVERLGVVASALEEALQRVSAVAAAAEAKESVGRIVATAVTAREEELEQKLAEAEAKIVSLQASRGPGRKTAQMFGKEHVAGAEALDGALVSLSVEQRIAVKAGLMRAGLV